MPKKTSSDKSRRSFHLEFKNQAQKIAWAGFEQHDVLFLIGPAGTGKTHLAMAFAVNELLSRRKRRIVLTRPVVEAGEKLGFLPGTMEEKVDPYMYPLYDCLGKLVGWDGPQREFVNNCIEKAPLAYMRGRTFDDAICIFDEAQNADMKQLKLFLTRLGENSKMIVTGDPTQSDLPGDVALRHVVDRLQVLEGVGVIEFKANAIVRHPLVGKIIEQLSFDLRPRPELGDK
jgi:phosphate starvation-inducible protein PhoH and related proteins